MEIGRERCKLNKSLFVSCIKNNRQKHSSQVFCVRAILELFSYNSSIVSFYILNRNYIQ